LSFDIMISFIFLGVEQRVDYEMNHERLNRMFSRSPLSFRVLNLIAQSEKPINPKKMATVLNKTEPSIHRVLDKLKKLGFLEENVGEDGRIHLYSIPRSMRKVVYSLIQEVETSRAYLMSSIEDSVEEELKNRLEGWDVREDERTNTLHALDLILSGRDIRVGLEIKMGLRRFERSVFEVIGEMVVHRNAPLDLIILVVIGLVRPRYADHVRNILIPLFSKPKLKMIFLDESPRELDRKEISRKIVQPILDEIQRLQTESKHEVD